MTNAKQLDQPVGLRLPREVLAELRRQARADDRTLSGYLRRLVVAAVQSDQNRGHRD